RQVEPDARARRIAIEPFEERPRVEILHGRDAEAVVVDVRHEVLVYVQVQRARSDNTCPQITAKCFAALRSRTFTADSGIALRGSSRTTLYSVSRSIGVRPASRIKRTSSS